MSRFTPALALAVSLIVASAPAAFSQAAAGASAPNGGGPWPRDASVGGAKIVVYQPQLESWNGNVLDAYSAVTIKTPGTDQTNYGVVWFTARTEVAKINRVVSLSDFALKKQNFPTAANNGAAYTSAFQGNMSWTESMPLDELETSLSASSVERHQQRVAVNNALPRIIVSTTPAVLVSIDGQQALRPSVDGFMKVINTRALILVDAAQNRYFLALMDGWVQSASLNGPWTRASNPPAALERIKAAAMKNDQNQAIDNDEQSLKDAYADGEAPAVHVATSQAELLLTRGEPVYSAIPGTSLSYVTNTSDDIFRDDVSKQIYVLVGGRWFTAPSLLNATWSYQPPTTLPSGFSAIPGYSPKADVLVAVPGTPQAKEAAIANQIPQTATISRSAARPAVKYVGAPEFQPITGSTLTYAVNSAMPVVFQPGGSYYACQTGVWFVSPAATGPWTVATTVPVEIYAIPASSPIHYVTYVQVYGYTPASVYVGYTPGYYGTVLTTDGLVVYGTGYSHPPYIGGDVWIPAPYTYGVGAAFSWSADAGWALGFGLGFGAGAIGPWWGPVGAWGWGAVAPAWGWGGYGGVASSNFYGHWGNAAFAGTRAAWANPETGNIGAGARGRFSNPVTGTSGIGARGGNFNGYTGNYEAGRRGAAYNPNTGVVKGGAHGVAYNGNNLYADHDGNVYRASSSGWQQHSLDGWHGLSSSGFRSALDNQSFARGLGSHRWGAFNSGGWAGRFGDGGFADRGFGGFRGRR